jgi:hypothetical protein
MGGGGNVYNVWQVSNDSGDTSVAMRPPFSSRQLASGGAGVAASCVTLSEYITPQRTSQLFDLACTSGLLVVPTSHLKINAYPTPGQLQDVPNRSTIRKLLRLPLELSYSWTRRDHDRYCRDVLLRPPVLLTLMIPPHSLLDSEVMC